MWYHYADPHFSRDDGTGTLPPQQWTPMNKLSLALLLIFVVGLIVFATWQLFSGNLAASFSTFPFLLIIYLFVLRLQRRPE